MPEVKQTYRGLSRDRSEGLKGTAWGAVRGGTQDLRWTAQRTDSDRLRTRQSLETGTSGNQPGVPSGSVSSGPSVVSTGQANWEPVGDSGRARQDRAVQSRRHWNTLGHCREQRGSQPTSYTVL